jgi:hypothetical protein
MELVDAVRTLDARLSQGWLVSLCEVENAAKTQIRVIATAIRPGLRIATNPVQTAEYALVELAQRFIDQSETTKSEPKSEPKSRYDGYGPDGVGR